MLIDTHCHLDIILSREVKILEKKDLPSILSILDRAKLNNVSRFINVGCDLIGSRNSLFLSENIGDVFATIGIHPTELNSEWRDLFIEFKKIFNTRSAKSKLVAIGEIGLDFYHKPFDFQKQKDGFLAQFEFALKNNLPVVIHCRDAANELVELLEPYAGQFTGVMHCFQQNEAVAKKVLSWGLALGIDCPIDYPKNNGLREICKMAGLENLILETDAPFLPPQKLRGKTNEPANLKYIAEELSKLLDTTPEIVAKKTTENTVKLFKLNDFS